MPHICNVIQEKWKRTQTSRPYVIKFDKIRLKLQQQHVLLLSFREMLKTSHSS